MANVLFVCTGNTCRSPMAEALLKHKGNSDIQVKSAGVYADIGSKASNNTQLVLEENGIECNHTSSPLTEELVEWATLILTMTTSHKFSVIDRFPHSAQKVYTLKEFVSEQAIMPDISDPFGGPIDFYRETYKELEPLIEALEKKIK